MEEGGEVVGLKRDEAMVMAFRAGALARSLLKLSRPRRWE
jgi:hypothetical protein